jgi:tetratricopeptide (TPR) repeat protein
VAAVAAVGLAAGVVVWQHRSDSLPAVPPEVPTAGVDPQVVSALGAAREAVLQDATSGRAWGELGMLFRVHGFYPQSNACFAEAARLDPENPRWPYLIGLINLLFTPDDAVPHLRAAYRLAKTPEHRSAVRLRLAEALTDRGAAEEAEALYREELAESPASPRVHLGLGIIASSRDDPAGASAHLEQAVASPFARQKASALLAAAARRAGDLPRAVAYERDARGGPPDLPWPDPFVSEYGEREAGRAEKWRRVEELQESGQFAEALSVLEELARSSPDTRTLLAMGSLLEKTGDYPAAAAVFRSVLAQNPNHATSRFYLGLALYNQAARLWERGDRGERTRALFEEALGELRRSTELKPGQGFAHLATGMTLRYLGRHPEAEAACREAVLVSPQVANCHLTLGEILLDRGRAAEAIPFLEEAARLDPREPRVKLMLAKARNATKP